MAEIGERVGPYEILDTLGSGGMGTVYLARDVRLARKVALKFIRSDHSTSGDDDTQQRLLHEARAASVLNHPNVCHVYDVGGEGRDSWIAMEYVEGAPLASIVQSKGRLPPGDVIHLGRQIAGALAHAHERGILHRDLKTANIVCDREGRPKILDFGIAGRLVQEIATEVTRSATHADSAAFAGTLPYMAPEVIRGSAQDARSDLWSLGVVLFELLTGSRPFDGRNAFDLAAAIVQGNMTPLPEHVPAPLARIVVRLLSNNPAERYGTAAETAAALDALADDRHAIPAGTGVAGRWPLLLLTFVLLGFGLYGLWRLTRPARLQLTEQRLISTIETSHRAPSYSPDGKAMAYVGPDAAGVDQIWVRDVQQGTSNQVTSGAVSAGRPRWLAANNQILFALSGQGIWTVSPMGGTPTRLIERGTNPSATRDGRRIAFENARTIWTAAHDGSDVRQVKGTQPQFYPFPLTPAISPDGSTIAYFHSALGPNGDFWTIPAAGGTPRRLTSDLREGGWPVWAPDGRTIIFSSARAGSRTLWQIPANGGEPSPLTTGAGEDDQPDITADGRQLAYTNVRNTWELRVRDLATGAERAILQRGLEVLFPMFSPDGQRLVYFGRSDYAVAIFTIGVDGSDVRQLTSGRELNHQPRWGADGRDIFFFQEHPTVSFRRVPALGGPSTEFRQWQWVRQLAPAFDRAGRSIAYLRSRPPGAPATVTEHTVIHDVASGTERVWPEPHTHVGGWSSDGASIVGLQHNPKGRDALTLVVICRVADATCRSVTTGGSPKWGPGGDSLYFTRPVPATGALELWTIGIDGNNERRIADLGMIRTGDIFIDVSRTGQVAWAPMRAGVYALWTAQMR